MEKQKIYTIVNCFYEITKKAFDYYNLIKDRNLHLYNAGNHLITTDLYPDKYANDNDRYAEWSILHTVYDKLDEIKEDYICFQHYRLFFKDIPENLDSDIYVHEPYPMVFRDPNSGQVWYADIEKGYKVCHIPECWDMLEKTLKLNNYCNMDLFNKWKRQTHLNAPCLLFIMKKDLFKEMFDFVNPVLKGFDKGMNWNTEILKNKYQHRQLAFLGERLFSLWVYLKQNEGIKVNTLKHIKFDDFKPFTDMQEREMSI